MVCSRVEEDGCSEAICYLGDLLISFRFVARLRVEDFRSLALVVSFLGRIPRDFIRSILLGLEG